MKKNNEMSDKNLTALRLKEVRRGAGWTQEQFAELFDISLAAYKKIEYAESQLSVTALRKVSREFNVSADYMLFGERPDFEDTWKMTQNCTEVEKFLLFMRLLRYFTDMRDKSYLASGIINESDEISERILDELKNNEKRFHIAE